MSLDDLPDGHYWYVNEGRAIRVTDYAACIQARDDALAANHVLRQELETLRERNLEQARSIKELAAMCRGFEPGEEAG